MIAGGLRSLATGLAGAAAEALFVATRRRIEDALMKPRENDSPAESAS